MLRRLTRSNARRGSGRRSGSGTPVERSNTNRLGRIVTERYRNDPRGRLVSRTYVPLRPRASIVPVRASACHASLTVVGLVPRVEASSRTVGSRTPTGSAPVRIKRPIDVEMPRALRSTICVARSSTEPIRGASMRDYLSFLQVCTSNKHFHRVLRRQATAPGAKALPSQEHGCMCMYAYSSSRKGLKWNGQSSPTAPS